MEASSVSGRSCTVVTRACMLRFLSCVRSLTTMYGVLRAAHGAAGAAPPDPYAQKPGGLPHPAAAAVPPPPACLYASRRVGGGTRPLVLPTAPRPTAKPASTPWASPPAA